MLRYFRRRSLREHGQQFRQAARDPRETRRVALGLFAVIGLAELLVALRFSLPTGVLLIAATSGLAAYTLRGISAPPVAAETGAAKPSDALKDELTGLPNRQQLIEQLTLEIARAQRYKHDLTLSLVEIGQFPELQTSWGAVTATNALLHVAETLRRVCRTSDVLARVDGSRFAVLLMQCNEEQAQVFGDRVSLAVSNRPLRSTASVSIPLYVSVEARPLQFDQQRFRGPLDFLSAAGGDVYAEVRAPRSRPGASATSGWNHPIPEEDYYPEGEMLDFAEAYRQQRTKSRRTG